MAAKNVLKPLLATLNAVTNIFSICIFVRDLNFDAKSEFWLRQNFMQIKQFLFIFIQLHFKAKNLNVFKGF